jgi:hypothetical protein
MGTSSMAKFKNMTYQEAKEIQVKRMYSPDNYGGIVCWELNWEEDAILLDGNYFDVVDSIQDFFEKESNLFTKLRDAVNFIEDNLHETQQ